MTAFIPRKLSHNVYTREPTDPAQHNEWLVEFVIEQAHAGDEPRLLDVLGWLRPDLCSSEIGERVTELLDLADTIACSSTRSIPWQVAVDNYAAALTNLATRPRTDDMFAVATAVQDEPAPIVPTLELVRS